MGRIAEISVEGNKYFVSDKGRVFRNNKKELSEYEDAYGYKYVVFRANGKRSKKMIHRLVANCFIPNPKELPQVNHIDGNKANNSVDNLEWIDNSGNQMHSRYVLNNKTGFADVPVKCKETGVTYRSTREAWRKTNISYSHISECANGKRKTAGGYHWEVNK